jgi:uncharacterized protein
MGIQRTLEAPARNLFQKYPVLTITGPRQSGKTTFVRQSFPDLTYANLEDMEAREFARSDPKGFLRSLGNQAIIDEIQNVPELTSAIQVRVDEAGENGLYILTGSRQFEVMEALSQSLAGRSALLTLLPFSLDEVSSITGSDFYKKDLSIERIMYTGFYPRIHDQKLEPVQF